MPRACSWWILAPVLGLTGCFEACDSSVVATLVKAQGQVESRTTPQWLPSVSGQAFRQGNALRTGPQSTAELELADDAQLLVSPDSVVWFGEPEQPFDLRVGAAEVVAGAATQVDGLKLGAKDRVAVRVGPEGRTKYEVQKQGQEVLSLSFGLAVIERTETPSAAPPDAGVADAGPSFATPELRVALSDGARIHSPRRSVELGVSDCNEAFVVARRGRRRIEGYGAVSIGPGRWRLKARCGDAVHEGVVHIVRDTGTARLVRRPPATEIDADGRNYTIYYQSHRPRMTLQWSRAPRDGAPFLLNMVAPGGRTSSHRLSKRAQKSLPGGSLREGKHTFTFVTADGRSSPKTQFKLAFDNNAPIARIRAPVEGEIAIDGRVTVRGEVIPGAELQVGGRSVAVDRAGRFSVLATTDDQTVVVRVQHPRTGVHYYLRHLEAGP